MGWEASRPKASCRCAALFPCVEGPKQAPRGSLLPLHPRHGDRGERTATATNPVWSSAAEVRLVEQAGLRRRQARLAEHVDDLVCDLSLLGGEARGDVPGEPRADVLVHAGLGPGELVGAAMEVAHLLEEC